MVMELFWFWGLFVVVLAVFGPCRGMVGKYLTTVTAVSRKAQFANDDDDDDGDLHEDACTYYAPARDTQPSTHGRHLRSHVAIYLFKEFGEMVSGFGANGALYPPREAQKFAAG